MRAHLLIRSRTARVQGLEGQVTSSGDRSRAGGIHHPEGSQHREGGNRAGEDDRTAHVHSCMGREAGSRVGMGRRSDHEVEDSRPQGRGEEAIGTSNGHRSNRGAGSCHDNHHGIRLGVGSSQQAVDHVGPSRRVAGRGDGHPGSEIGRGRLLVACRAGSALAEY